MLYKKYHKNHVRKFKKGTKFEYIYIDEKVGESITAKICCTGEPMIVRVSDACRVQTYRIQIPVSRDDYAFGFHTNFILVFEDGFVEVENIVFK